MSTKFVTGWRTKNKIWKKIEFGVATVVYFGKQWKNQKDKTMFAKNQILGSEVDISIPQRPF